METSKVEIEVVNQELYMNKIVDVDTTGLKIKGYAHNNEFVGNLDIEEENGAGWVTYSGEFGADDYVEEFGFRLISK